MAVVGHSLKSKALGTAWTSLDPSSFLQAPAQACLLCIFVPGSLGWAHVSPFLPHLGPFLKDNGEPMLSPSLSGYTGLQRGQEPEVNPG